MLAVLSLICVGLLGACLFTTGIVFGMMPLTVTGNVLLALTVVCMFVWYLYQKPQGQGQSQMQIERQGPVVAYTTNHMNTISTINTMKRNKSDTDLELINRESQDT